MIQTFELAAYSISIDTYQRQIILDIVLAQTSPSFILLFTTYAPLLLVICHIASTKKGKLEL